MEIFHEAMPALLKESAIALGFFDGVHPGHQVVIGKAVEEARRLGVKSAVVTFTDHPRGLTRGNAPPLLTVIEQRAELFARLGVDLTLALSFTEDLCRLTPREYVQTVLVGALGARSVSVGYNHHFGRDREGDPSLLKVLGQELGFDVHVAPLVYVGDLEVSSSRVRECVTASQMEMAAKLLTRPYAVIGQVIKGDGRGRQIGFPTANLAVSPVQLIPGRGVYAGWARIDGVNKLPAVINVGFRPTFKGAEVGLLIEVHVLDFDQDIYGKSVTVDFLHFIRAEQKFDGIDSLCRQIGVDCATARDILRNQQKESGAPEHKLPA